MDYEWLQLEVESLSLQPIYMIDFYIIQIFFLKEFPYLFLKYLQKRDILKVLEVKLLNISHQKFLYTQGRLDQELLEIGVLFE